MNKLKRSLANNEVTFGTWVQIPCPTVVEILDEMEFDWICIDAEHGVFDLTTIADMVRSIKKSIPIVRVPKLDEIWIHRILDLGVEGIIVPMIKTKDDVDKLIEYAKYPPIGKRGYGFSRQNNYGNDSQDFSRTNNEDLSIIVQIEHVDAILNLEEILDNKYVDGSFIGPLDLEWSIRENDNFSYKNLLHSYVNISKKIKKTMGIHIIHPNARNIRNNLSMGYKTIALGLDVAYLSERSKELSMLSNGFISD